MLTRLSIENIALVESADLEFEPGLSVLTGETGGGKTVIVNALSLALGARAEKDMIRHGTRQAVVEGEFSVGGNNEPLAVRREITHAGGSKVEIDGDKATVNELRSRVQPLAQIMGQHSGQELLDEERHIHFLDSFGDVQSLVRPVEKSFYEWQHAERELKNLRAHRDRIQQERELAQFQKDEIEKASIRVGEEEELIQERRVLDAARELMASAAILEDLLGGEEHSVMARLATARKELEKMAQIDQSLQEQAQSLNASALEIEELRRTIEQYGTSIQDDPQRLEEVNERLDLIYRMKKKYGGSETAILETLEQLDARLGEEADAGSRIRHLEEDVAHLRGQYQKAALALTEAREKAGERLEKLVVKELKELAIARPRFCIEFMYEDDAQGIPLDDRTVRAGDNGLETARIMFSANPGEPLKPLVRTASGGEISRVLLALKSAEMTSRSVSPSLLVFDEVDVGIGGQTAVEVARKLKKVSEKCQVLVITHLHQIARLADHHYVAEKRVVGKDRTVIDVRQLCDNEVSEEIDRMVALPEGAP